MSLDFHRLASPLALLALLLPAIPSSAAAADAPPATHVVRVDRIEKAGARYKARVRAFDSTTTVISLEGKELQRERESKNLTLEGILTIVEVDASGEPVRIDFKVSKGTTLEEGKSRSLGLDGKTLEVRSFPELSIVVAGGKELDEQTRALLDLVFDEAEDPETSENRRGLMDPAGPVAVGATWHPDPGPLADSLQNETQFEVDRKSVTVEAKLAAVGKTDGVETQEVAIRMSIGDLRMPVPDMTVRSSTMTIDTRGVIPAAGPEGSALRESTRIVFRILGDVENAELGKALQVTIESTRTDEWDRTPMPAKK